MKTKPNFLPFLFAGSGVLTAALRLAQAIFATDSKGLLICGHPLDLLIWGLTAVTAIAAVLTVRKLDGSSLYADNFSPSIPAASGCLMMAAGILSCLLSNLMAWSLLERVRNYLGLAAVIVLVVLAFFRLKGKQPFFLFHGAVCLYLMVHTISHYQIWCAQPLIQSFFFPMAASICLTLFAYYQTAFDVGLGKRRMQLGMGLAGSFLCLAAAANGEDVMLYLGGGFWMLTNLCSLTPVPKPEPEKKEEEK